MRPYLIPLGAALLMWWASTALIIWLYRRSEMVARQGLWGASVLLLVSLVGTYATRSDTSTLGAYIAFGCGVTAFGWQLLAYYAGVITGKVLPLPVFRSVRQRFVFVLRAGLHHELAAALGALGMAALVWGAPNQLAWWVYVLLWLMHTSAKLCVFFGVPAFNPALLPTHLHFLAQVLPVRRCNAFLPAAVSIGAIVTIFLFGRGVTAPVGSFEQTSLLMLGTMQLLGVLEHGLLMIPSIPSVTALFRTLRGKKARRQPTSAEWQATDG